MSKKRNFTLIELLAVVAIIAIVAGILLGGMNYAAKKADVAKTQAAMEKLIFALDAFKEAKGYYPPCSSNADVQFIEASSEFKLKLGSSTYSFQNSNGKPYIEFQVSSTASDYTDAWDNAFQYMCPGSHNTAKYDLFSKGADGTADNDDDITNW